MELLSIIKQKHTKYVRCPGSDSRLICPELRDFTDLVTLDNEVHS